MALAYRMIMEDATRYLPHDPTGREYVWYVYDTTKTGPFGGELLVYSGTREECQTWIARVSGQQELTPWTS